MNKLTKYKTDKIFKRLLDNKSKENYWKYISELRKRGTTEIFKKCILLTNSEKIKERILGVDVLAQFDYPRINKTEILNIFFKLLKAEKDSNLLFSVFYGIGHNNEDLDEENIKLICSFKNNKSIKVRHSLTFCLCGIENVNAINTLIELSEDKDKEIRNWATFGIGNLIENDNNEIRTALWNRVNDTHQETKLEAILALANRNDKKIIEIIITELKNREFGELLFEAILILNDKCFLPILKENLKFTENNREIPNHWVLELKECIENLNKNNERTT